MLFLQRVRSAPQVLPSTLLRVKKTIDWNWLSQEDYNIQLTEDGNLMVTLERKNENQEKEGRRYLRREFSYQHFSQAFTLPDDVDREKISASVKEGILYVDLPKKSAEAMSIGKKIEIQ